MGRHALPDSMELLEKIKQLKAAGHKNKEISDILKTSTARISQLWQQYLDRLEKQGEESTEDKIEEVDASPNEKTVSFKGLDNGRVNTLDQLLVLHKVDPKEWMVDHWILNQWEGYRKNLSKDLVWEKGVVTGFVKDLGGLFVAPLIQVKAWLVRKNPIPLEPCINFVHITPHKYPDRNYTKRETALEMAMVGLECHMGFFRNGNGEIEPLHDRRAMNIFLQVAQEYEVDKVVIIGDLLDFPDLTDKYRREPGFEQQMQPTLNEAAQYMADLRLAVGPDCEIEYVPGNHEERIKKMLIDHLPQIFHLKNRKMNTGLLSLQNLLGLDELNIKVADGYPDGMAWINDNLRVIHGVGLSAPKIVDGSDVSTIFGHIHRYEADSRTTYARQGPRVVTAMSTGFMGRVDGLIPGVKKDQNWCQSFAVVYYDDKDFTIVNVPIQNGVCILDNLRWTAE